MEKVGKTGVSGSAFVVYRNCQGFIEPVQERPESPAVLSPLIVQIVTEGIDVLQVKRIWRAHQLAVADWR